MWDSALGPGPEEGPERDGGGWHSSKVCRWGHSAVSALTPRAAVWKMLALGVLRTVFTSLKDSLE